MEIKGYVISLPYDGRMFAGTEEGKAVWHNKQVKIFETYEDAIQANIYRGIVNKVFDYQDWIKSV